MISHRSQPLLAKPQISQGLEQKKIGSVLQDYAWVLAGGTNLRIGGVLNFSSAGRDPYA